MKVSKRLKKAQRRADEGAQGFVRGNPIEKADKKKLHECVDEFHGIVVLG
jgi:hypothetical protein